MNVDKYPTKDVLLIRPIATDCLRLTLLFVTTMLASYGASADRVMVSSLKGEVNNGSVDQVIRDLENAEATSSHLFVLKIDTPGGYIEPTRRLVCFGGGFRGIVRCVNTAKLRIKVRLSGKWGHKLPRRPAAHRMRRCRRPPLRPTTHQRPILHSETAVSSAPLPSGTRLACS